MDREKGKPRPHRLCENIADVGEAKQNRAPHLFPSGTGAGRGFNGASPDAVSLYNRRRRGLP